MRKYIEFIISRMLGTCVDTLVLWLCSDFIFSGNYFGRNILSPAISFEFAVMSNFLCSYYWIWSSRVETKNTRSFFKHFFIFNLSSLSGFLVKMAFLLLFEHLFGWDVIICNLAALLISGVFNFFLEKTVVFRKRKQRPAHELLNIDELATISPVFTGRWGRLLARLVVAVCDMNKLNILYDQVYFDRGVACTDKLLRYMGCDYLMGNPERLDNLPDGAFITVSNQPYGALDAIVLIDMLCYKRGDYRILASELLSRIEPLNESFVYINDAAAGGEGKFDAVSQQLNHGEPVGIFPCEGGPKYYFNHRRVVDKKWNEDTLRFIQEARVPILPIRFLDRNSRFYYGLGLISMPLRLMRLPSELFNKNKGQHRVVVGEVISVEEQERFTTLDDFHKFLRSSVYDMPNPEHYMARSERRGYDPLETFE